MHALVNRTPAFTDYSTPKPRAGSGLHRFIANAAWPARCCADAVGRRKTSAGTFSCCSESRLATNTRSWSTRLRRWCSCAFTEAAGLGNLLGGTFLRRRRSHYLKGSAGVVPTYIRSRATHVKAKILDTCLAWHEYYQQTASGFVSPWP